MVNVPTYGIHTDPSWVLAIFSPDLKMYENVAACIPLQSLNLHYNKYTSKFASLQPTYLSCIAYQSPCWITFPQFLAGKSLFFPLGRLQVERPILTGCLLNVHQFSWVFMHFFAMFVHLSWFNQCRCPTLAGRSSRPGQSSSVLVAPAMVRTGDGTRRNWSTVIWRISMVYKKLVTVNYS